MRSRTHDKADRATPWLALLVSALIAVVAVIGYLIYDGAASGRDMRMAVNLPSPTAAPQPTPAPLHLPKPVVSASATASDQVD